MTKETPITLDQITIETLRILETDLAFQRNMTRRDDENDSSPMRIRMPQVTYTPRPPRFPWNAAFVLGLLATGAFIGVWFACALAFLL